MDDGATRADRDIFRLAPSMDASVVQTIADRLEFRRTDDRYTRLSQAYFERLPLDSARRVLAVGCGTGVEVRALRRRAGPEMEIIGVDHSPTLIDLARRLTQEEGLSGNVAYEIADAHHLPYADGEFDVVVLHTLLSHVDDPPQVLRETRRVVRPGGTVAIFDGDYASMTFAHPDPALAELVEAKLQQILVANPRIMRDMPRLLRDAELDLAESEGVLYADIGVGGFWPNTAETFGGVLERSGQIEPDVAADWRAFQRRAVDEGTFFGASNYYTYLARRPD